LHQRDQNAKDYRFFPPQTKNKIYNPYGQERGRGSIPKHQKTSAIYPSRGDKPELKMKEKSRTTKVREKWKQGVAGTGENSTSRRVVGITLERKGWGGGVVDREEGTLSC